jgi:hypothetical protein
MKMKKSTRAYNRGIDSLIKSLDREIFNTAQKINGLLLGGLPHNKEKRQVIELKLSNARERLEMWKELRDHVPPYRVPLYRKSKDSDQRNTAVPPSSVQLNLPAELSI